MALVLYFFILLLSQRTRIYLILLPVSTGDSGNGGGGGGNSSTSQLVPKERTQAKQAPDMCTGIQELYYASYNEDGRFCKENSAWITEAGMILLPNDRNDTNISHNDALPTKYIGGKPMFIIKVNG